MNASRAGYSAAPLVRKLGIKPGARVGLLSAPEGFDSMLDPLPEGVALRRQARGPLDVIVAFHSRRAALERRLPALCAALDPRGGLWIAWPKRVSGVPSDLDEHVVRELIPKLKGAGAEGIIEYPLNKVVY